MDGSGRRTRRSLTNSNKIEQSTIDEKKKAKTQNFTSPQTIICDSKDKTAAGTVPDNREDYDKKSVIGNSKVVEIVSEKDKQICGTDSTTVSSGSTVKENVEKSTLAIAGNNGDAEKHEVTKNNENKSKIENTSQGDSITNTCKEMDDLPRQTEDTPTDTSQTDVLNQKAGMNKTEVVTSDRKMGRPRRNAKKALDPDFVSDIPSKYKRGGISTDDIKSPKRQRKSIATDEKSTPKHGAEPSKQTGNEKLSDVKKTASPDKKKRKKSLKSPIVMNAETKAGLSHIAKRSRLSYEEEEKAVENQDGKIIRRCARSGCSTTRPICFVRASDRCSGSGYTSRWYHLSMGEHFCNSCFEHYYRAHKPGYECFSQWKRSWVQNSQSDPGIIQYMADQHLPYWLKCNKCGKWRQVSRDADITEDLVQRYQCGMNHHGVKKKGNTSCQTEEDSRIKEMNDPYWLGLHLVATYLRKSLASPFLRHYYPDGVGMSSYYHTSIRKKSKSESKQKLHSGSESSDLSSEESEDELQKILHPEDINNETLMRETEELVPGSNPYLQPFHQPETAEAAMTLRPDVMEDEEQIVFPEFTKDRTSFRMYLGIRNMMLAAWSLNFKEWLTLEKCQGNFVCRGLTRVRWYPHLNRILQYLTIQGYVNSGIVERPQDVQLIPDECKQEDILVIGGGPGGLAAAHHLHKMGCRVQVLEAQSRLGGRVCDDTMEGLCVGRGAQIINGCINNPISIICQQKEIKMRTIMDHCDLIDERGVVTESHIDKRIDFHFNAMLDNVAEWRKNKTPQTDVNLLEKIRDMHKQFLEESQLTFSEEEENLLQFHISNLEYACGCEMNHVSAVSWDQNEKFPQFAGPHILISDGYSAVIRTLAKDLHLHLCTEVSSIDSSGEKVVVRTISGQEFTGTRVVVALPLTVLRNKALKFVPPLPQEKAAALDKLGAGLIEKVMLSFPSRFWADKLKNADCFGHIPRSDSERGLFSVFYDMSPKDGNFGNNSKNVLMTYISGPALKLVQHRKDEEIIEKCMLCLRNMFPDKEVPNPQNSFVTRWHHDPYSQMAYTYLPVGCSGDVYDILSEEIDQKVFFAGEATNRNFPQTVTGAYLSGIREAVKILELHSQPQNANQRKTPLRVRNKKRNTKTTKKTDRSKKPDDPDFHIHPPKRRGGSVRGSSTLKRNSKQAVKEETETGELNSCAINGSNDGLEEGCKEIKEECMADNGPSLNREGSLVAVIDRPDVPDSCLLPTKDTSFVSQNEKFVSKQYASEKLKSEPLVNNMESCSVNGGNMCSDVT